MIGLVRELTEASLLAAVWKPRIAAPCRSRMKSSSVKALTMRTPCAVSCSDSIICIAPANSRGHDPAHALADLAHAERRDGHEHQREDREHGVLRHHHDHEADDGQRVARQGRDQQVEGVAGRLGDERLPRDEFRRMRLAVIGDLHPQHLVEDARLDVGDDAVGDARQRHLLAVGGEALDGVDGDDGGGDLPDRR